MPMTTEQIAQIPLEWARIDVRDLVHRAYDAGKDSVRTVATLKPSDIEIARATAALEKATLTAAMGRMEEVAKRCGFEGLTEALGYLQTLRENPLAELLREAVNLAALGMHEHAGWTDWYARARAVVGDKTPPRERESGFNLRIPKSSVEGTTPEEVRAEVQAALRSGRLPEGATIEFDTDQVNAHELAVGPLEAEGGTTTSDK